MAVTYHHAQQFIGQPVCCHCHDGKHYGIVRSVTRDGIWLESLPARGAVVSGTSKELQVNTADQPDAVTGENVYYGGYGYGYNPGAFFLPFFALLALTPLLFW